jgi:hypothetical protein
LQARAALQTTKLNYGRWATLVMCKGLEATALSTKSTRLHPCQSNTVENDKIVAILSVEIRKTARSSFFLFVGLRKISSPFLCSESL